MQTCCNRNLLNNYWNSTCNQILHLEGSMNLNTVPEGDMALGYEVARKYSSPGNTKLVSGTNISTVQCWTSQETEQTLPASSSAKEMMNLWWWLMSPGKEQVVWSPMQTLLSFQLPAVLSSSSAISRLIHLCRKSRIVIYYFANTTDKHKYTGTNKWLTSKTILFLSSKMKS